ncbi:MAG: iron export ABC transporter permease subunit FetB [Myxococcales bacterium]|nr:iron export ABC transporter permease subunit FetB [Myxococcales bacterium]
MATASAIALSTTDLAIAGGLVLVAGVVSVAMRLDLERKLLLGAVRTVVQLILLGYCLEFLFQIESAPLVLGWLGIMITAAGRAAMARPSRTYKGAFLSGWIGLAISALLTTFTVTGAIVGIDPWYDPQYLIPFAGMVLGNSLTGISLTVDSLLETLDDKQDEVECLLCLGATRWEAARGPIQIALRRGMTPILNSMAVVGLVSIPGMMTGQILAGAAPMAAVRYQIVVMFMLAGATAMGSIAVAWLVYRRMFNDRHQLRMERIIRRDS